MSATSSFHTERLQRDEYAKWLSDLADWSHAVTVTCQPSLMGFDRSQSSTISATINFVHVLNRLVLGRTQIKQGHKIACVAVCGNGAYGDNPHVHLAFQAPSHMSYEAMKQAISCSIQRTHGLGIQEDIQHYTSDGWIKYMLDHGTEGLLVQLTTPAKY